MDPPQRSRQDPPVQEDRHHFHHHRKSIRTMVARINTVRSTAKPLTYNEQKVAQGRAECIHTGNFLQSKDRLSYDDKLRRFQRLNEMNGRSQVKMFHATLNFSPKEMLSNHHLAAIADRYMQGLKMDNQPYLVYRHND